MQCRSRNTTPAATSSRSSAISSMATAPKSPGSVPAGEPCSWTGTDTVTAPSGSTASPSEEGLTRDGRGAPARPVAFRSPLWGFIIRRLLLGVVVLFLVSVVVFAATQALPGDAARAILGRNATPDSLQALREQLHLNRPLVL